MIKSFTFSELVEYLENRGDNLAEVAIGRMMDDIEAETGLWPKWTDPVPEWILSIAL